MDLCEVASINLGERIVKAARLAAAMHAYQSVQGKLLSSQDDDLRQDDESDDLRQRVRIGGAGPVVWGSSADRRDAPRATHVTEDGRPA